MPNERDRKRRWIKHWMPSGERANGSSALGSFYVISYQQYARPIEQLEYLYSLISMLFLIAATAAAAKLPHARYKSCRNSTAAVHKYVHHVHLAFRHGVLLCSTELLGAEASMHVCRIALGRTEGLSFRGGSSCVYHASLYFFFWFAYRRSGPTDLPI